MPHPNNIHSWSYTVVYHFVVISAGFCFRVLRAAGAPYPQPTHHTHPTPPPPLGLRCIMQKKSQTSALELYFIAYKLFEPIGVFSNKLVTKDKYL